MFYSPLARPDAATFSFLLKACSKAVAAGKCREVHGSIFRFGFPSNVIVCTNLSRAYADNGSVEDARKVFDEMPERDIVSWNSIIACYCKEGLHIEALKVFEEMRAKGLGLDEFTVVVLLSSCAHLGALELGVWVHRYSWAWERSNIAISADAAIWCQTKLGIIPWAADGLQPPGTFEEGLEFFI
ncbi:hypothetical protein HPP92_016502 [Vanilla planifolia]|nr:hypothetical protein HPP92_016502 [Vanilla planifolia]